MAVPLQWHNWATATWNGDALVWDDMWFYFTCPNYSFYYLVTNEARVDINTFVAIKLIKDKCDSLQAQVDALGAPTELTMDAILDTVYNSDKLHWFHFINYIDSMRAGIWNLEIYETHLAEMYRHFSI